MAEPVTHQDVAETVRDGLERLHPAVFGWALFLTGGDRGEAEEALQISYLRILSGEARFGGRSRFETWAFGVVRRVCGELRRRRAVRHLARLRWLGAARDIDLGPGPAELAERAQRAARTRRALARLSARQREVLHLVFYQEMTIEESAAVLGISAGSARTHYERGKARLRKLLAGEAR